jgi:hypothetical protein
VIGVEKELPVVTDETFAAVDQLGQELGAVIHRAIREVVDPAHNDSRLVAADLFEQDPNGRLEVEVSNDDALILKAVDNPAADPLPHLRRHAEPLMLLRGLVAVDGEGDPLDPARRGQLKAEEEATQDRAASE